MIFSIFSLAGGFVVWWIIAAIFLIVYEQHRNRRFLLYFTGGIGLAFVISDLILKNILMRARPMVNGFCPADFSFPSAHATTAFAAAVVLAKFDPKRKIIYYAMAIIVSFSRVYLGCHYLGDVLAGGLIGSIISRIALSVPLPYNKRGRPVHKK